MDWSTYKRICDQPDVMTRWSLQRTLALVDDGQLAQQTRELMASAPIDKPSGHKGDASTDCFALDFDSAVVERVIRVLQSLAAESDDRQIRHLATVWEEYLGVLEGPGGTIPGPTE